MNEAKPTDLPAPRFLGRTRVFAPLWAWALPAVPRSCALAAIGSWLAVFPFTAGCGSADTPEPATESGSTETASSPAGAEYEADGGAPTSAEDSDSRDPDSTDSPEALRAEELTVATGLLQRFPEDAETLGLLAMVHRGQGHAAKATEYWERCLALNPNLADVHDGMGTVANRQGNTQEAIVHWQHARALRPDLPGLYERLGRALIDVGRSDEAIELLRDGLTRGLDPAELHVLQGEAHMQLKQFEDAGRAFEKALELRPDATAHYGLGMVAAKSGDTAAARRHMTEFQRLKAAGLESQVTYVETLDQSVEARQRAARVHEMAGRLLASKSQFEDATVHWKRAAQLDSKNWRSRVALARAFAARADADSAAAAASLALAENWAIEAWRLRPPSPGACAELGRILAEAGRYEDAASAYGRALEHRPDRMEWARAGASAMLQGNGDAAKARTLLLKSLDQEPDAEGYHLLAQTFVRTGDRSAALAAAKRAMEMEPNHPEYANFYETLQQTP